MNSTNETRTPKRSSSGPIIGGVVILLLGAGAAFQGISSRAATLKTVTKETQDLDIAGR